MQFTKLAVGSALLFAVCTQPAFAAFLQPGETVTWQHNNGATVWLDGQPVPVGESFEFSLGSTLEIGTGFTDLSVVNLPGTEDIEFLVELLPTDEGNQGVSIQAPLGVGSFNAIAYGDYEGNARAVITAATEPVPEPMTILGSLAAVGLGVMLRGKRA